MIRRTGITFNRAFLQFAHDEAARRKLPVGRLHPLTHVLIDEFQDISPQIASWLKACQRTLACAGRNPTIMAIGDDWQSIYGWRGSAPEFFINFDQHLPIHSSIAPARKCFMTENFRSVEPIVRQSEAMLQPVKNKVAKVVVPKRVAEEWDRGIDLRIGEISGRIKDHLEFIRDQYNEAVAAGQNEKNKVILLFRTNEIRKEFRERMDEQEKELGPTPDLVSYTFHGAKGLQGEVAILFEEPEYRGSHLIRNNIYEQARIFSQSYDEAMTDEAYRVAYVAVTRGMRRVFWIVPEARHAAAALLMSGIPRE